MKAEARAKLYIRLPLWLGCLVFVTVVISADSTGHYTIDPLLRSAAMIFMAPAFFLLFPVYQYVWQAVTGVPLELDSDSIRTQRHKRLYPWFALGIFLVIAGPVAILMAVFWV